MSQNKIFHLCTGMLLFGFTIGAAQAANLYTITDLGKLSISFNEAQNLRLKINESNRVIGWTNISGNKTVGFYWTQSTGNIQPLAAESTNKFSAISASQQVAGVQTDANNNSRAMLWSGNFNNATDLGDLGGGSSIANDINSSGTVVGESQNQNQVAQAFRWSNGTMLAVTANASVPSRAVGINDSGWIAGDIIVGSYWQSYISDGNSLTSLSDIDPNVESSWSADINNLNQVVGGMKLFPQISGSQGYSNQYQNTAFLWSAPNTLVNLADDVNSIWWANGINNQSSIVGGRLFGLRKRQAVLWEDGVAYDLNMLTQGGEFWELQDATDINEAGVIVGVGQLSSEYHAFMLTPVVSGVATADLSIQLASANISNKPSSRALAINTQQKIVLTALNRGPAIATNVMVEIITDLPLKESDISSTLGACRMSGSTVQCEASQLAPDDALDLQIDLASISEGTYDLSASVSATETDAGVNSNNAISDKITISKAASVVVSDPADTTSQSSPVNNDTSDSQNNTGTTGSDNSTPEQPGAKSEDSSSTAASQSNSSASGGCSIGRNDQGFDPVFALLLLLALYRVSSRRELR